MAKFVCVCVLRYTHINDTPMQKYWRIRFPRFIRLRQHDKKTSAKSCGFASCFKRISNVYADYILYINMHALIIITIIKPMHVLAYVFFVPGSLCSLITVYIKINFERMRESFCCGELLLLRDSRCTQSTTAAGPFCIGGIDTFRGKHARDHRRHANWHAGRQIKFQMRLL